MSQKKYEFTGETKERDGRTLQRIRRLSDGALGGWIEKETNLSHDGDCWVYDNGEVYENGRITEDACVLNTGRVFGNAKVYGTADVTRNSRVFGNALVYGDSLVDGEASVHGASVVCDDACVLGNAVVCDAIIEGHGVVSGTEIVKGPSPEPPPKKYEFTGETKEHNGRTLKRICRLSDGTPGGWIEKESNLSHEGDCWVFNDAMVYDDAQVLEDARVRSDAQVYGNATILSNAEVWGRACVCDDAMVHGNAIVREDASVSGNAEVFGDAVVCEQASVSGDSIVCGEEVVRHSTVICNEHVGDVPEPAPADASPTHLPEDSKARKKIPLATGLLDYFPDACIAVAALSQIGNDQHNPGQPLHWSRDKSNDHDDCLMRHFVDRGTIDTDGVRHSAKVAWRALALLQLEIEGAE